jgi:hypothetical protein
LNSHNGIHSCQYILSLASIKHYLTKKVFEGLFYLLYSQGLKKGFNMGATEVLRTATPLVSDDLSVAQA